MTDLAPSAAEVVFRYTALDRNGRRVTDVVRSTSERGAFRTLAADGLTPLSLIVERQSAQRGKDRPLKFAERVTVLRQLALMVEAGIGLLEAITTISGGIEARQTQVQFEQLTASLKRGETFANALEAQVPDFPFYVYAMIRVGEATGQLGDVLRDAAEQMAYEDRLRRDFVNAMTYPGFLASAGAAAVLFIFTQVVPRFASMIGDKRDKMPLVSRWVIDIGQAANQNIVLVMVTLGAMGGGIALAASNAGMRQRAYRIAHGFPLVGDMLKAREIASWARLTAFALANGVGLLEASNLARRAAPDGDFKRGLEQFERELRTGVAIDQSLARHTRLTAMDLSLIRSGQKSGTLPKMFAFLADGYDERLRDSLKRLTALIEPIAIGLISILVGVVALSLILALSSVYDSVF
jgi:general secretion pathway protein F